MANDAQLIVLGAVLGFVAWEIRRRNAVDPETGETDNSADVADLGNQLVDGGSAILNETDDVTAQANITAMLAAIRVGEGTSGSNGYHILCGGTTFDSFDTHPALAGWTGWQMPLAMAQAAGFPNGAVSTAAGAYQINRPTFKRLADKIGNFDLTFTPDMQDRMALELIREKGAMADVMAGRVATAVAKLAKVWASLPSATYGQRTVSLQNFLNNFTQAGGQIA